MARPCGRADRVTVSVVIKVGMVGDSQIGKTSLMVKYVEGSFDEDYIQTLGECVWLRHILDVLTTVKASTSWKRPFLSEERQLPSRSGILEGRGNSSICCL